MTVDPATSKHRFDYRGETFHFCSAGCRSKFAADPQNYLGESRPKADHPAGTVYTCPMHPEIRQIGPGSCPICGMALEPEVASLDAPPNPELAADAQTALALRTLCGFSPAEIAAAQNAAPETRQKSAVTIRKQVDRISEMVGANACPILKSMRSYGAEGNDWSEVGRAAYEYQNRYCGGMKVAPFETGTK
jgi:YHS domain-containing protein